MEEHFVKQSERLYAKIKNELMHEFKQEGLTDEQMIIRLQDIVLNMQIATRIEQILKEEYNIDSDFIELDSLYVAVEFTNKLEKEILK